jgi:protein involved in polysaccharide export with SLBB domain
VAILLGVTLPGTSLRARTCAFVALSLLATAAAGCRTDLPPLIADPLPRVGVTLPLPPEGGYDLDRPYPLLPGDTIVIKVKDDEKLNDEQPVRSNGEIEVWGSEVKEGGKRETLKVKGMTVDELREKLADIYQQTRVSRPYVQVVLARAVPRSIFIRGAVKADKGTVDLPPGSRMTLYRAIQAAGGTADDADLSQVTITRRDPTTGSLASLPVFDLEEMTLSASYDRDPPLEPDDIVTVPKLGKVSIFGNINAPGSYLCTRNMTITDLIAAAGSNKPFSKMSDIRVIRDEGTGRQRTYSVDVEAVLEGSAVNPKLAPGDCVWIYETWK